MSALTAKQEEAQDYCAGPASDVMLFGGSRSGKTFLHVRNVVFRALKAPNSRHGIFRFRANHLKASIFLDTMPKVMRVMFPGVKWEPHTQDMYVTLPGVGSEIWFAGLDDKERVERILGMEFATLLFNECSQIPYASITTAKTRLAQRVTTSMEGRKPALLKTRCYYDCNPPSQSHWTYQLFKLKRDPETKKNLPNPEDYASFQMNPRDNVENLSPEYLKTLETLPARMRKRFLEGNFADANPNALFPEEVIERWRHNDATPDMVRVVVAVDPSGADDDDNADNDAIGIVTVGIGTDGNAYVLEDSTVKAGPATWGKVATSAFDRHSADCIVGEINFGGAMVKQTIQVARPRTPFKTVTASRGKVQRAEPFSALYEAGKVRHAGMFVELEEELGGFSTHGYTGTGSPNRADALIWGLAELFPAITRGAKEKKQAVAHPRFQSHGQTWMA